MAAGNKLDLDRLEILGTLPSANGGLGGDILVGTVDLIAGQAFVADSLADTDSIIFLTIQNINAGVQGFLWIESRTVGVNFEIRSSSNLDTSTVAYMRIQPP